MIKAKIYVPIILSILCVCVVAGILLRDKNADGGKGHPSVPVNSTSATSVAPETVSESRILYPDENGNIDISNRSSSITPATATEIVGRVAKIDLFPKPPVCGPMSLGEKIHGGAEAELGEFPWLVNLEYRTEFDDLEIGCAGNILNHRYVLTAAHCVKGGIEKLLGQLESLRVGDHNTETDKDCIDDECIEPFERFGIAERLIHDRYNYTKRIVYDIALLKTDRSIIYSFSVAPICLPNVISTLEPPIIGARLTVAGWGDNGTADYTDEKRIVDVPYTSCPFRVDPTQLCAGGEFGKDSCVGDSGGSLARRTHRFWIIEGIVSIGRGCGTERPAIYTRVRSFLDWIHDHVKEP